MSWTGEYWSKNGAVACAKQRFESSQKDNLEYVAYSSVCYSAANRVFADLLHLRWDGIRRLVEGVRLARLSVRLIDSITLRDLKLFGNDIDGYANTLDIGCAVYARYGWLSGGRRKVLGRWIKNASDLIDTCKAQDCHISPHTKVILILHKIRFQGKGLRSDSYIYTDIMRLVCITLEAKDYAQVAQIYWQLAKLICINNVLDERIKKSLLENAELYTQTIDDAFDQLTKL